MSKNQTKHTPGKWTISGHHCGAIRIKSGDAVVAYAPADDVPEFQSDSNARLIAAAPELLEALKYAAELIPIARLYFPKSCKHGDKFTLENTRATISAAIAKADGKE